MEWFIYITYILHRHPGHVVGDISAVRFKWLYVYIVALSIPTSRRAFITYILQSQSHITPYNESKRRFASVAYASVCVVTVSAVVDNGETATWRFSRCRVSNAASGVLHTQSGCAAVVDNGKAC